MKRLPVEKACVLSTAHLTKEDAALLTAYAAENPNRLPRIQTHQHGWLVFLPAVDKHEHRAQLRELKTIGFSQAFRVIYALAMRQGISILDFDSAGVTVDGVPRFDW